VPVVDGAVNVTLAVPSLPVGPAVFEAPNAETVTFWFASPFQMPSESRYLRVTVTVTGSPAA